MFVHLCSAAQWTAITGEVPPPTPVDRAPTWTPVCPDSISITPTPKISFPSEILTRVKSVGKRLGAEEDPFVPVDPGTVIALGGVSPDAVTDGKW